MGRIAPLMGAYLRWGARSPHDDHRCIGLAFQGNVGNHRRRVAEEVGHRFRLPQGTGAGWRIGLQFGAASADAQGRHKPQERR